MKAASVNEIKQELKELNPAQLSELCLRLARFKKESKELLSFLLFEAGDTSLFSAKVKAEVDELFSLLKAEKNLYFTKKSLRKILRTVTKYSRYAASDELTAEWLLYFCTKLNDSGIPFRKSPVLVNMYQNQLKKINKLVEGMHEDMQGDYQKDLDQL